jgi:hypothetical protein
MRWKSNQVGGGVILNYSMLPLANYIVSIIDLPLLSGSTSVRRRRFNFTEFCLSSFQSIQQLLFQRELDGTLKRKVPFDIFLLIVPKRLKN